MASNPLLFNWKAFLRRVSMKYPPMDLRWEAEGCLVQVKATVPDRDTGLPMPLYTMSHLVTPNMSDIAAAQELRDIMATTLVHELDEQFLLDGERIFDPHKKRETR